MDRETTRALGMFMTVAVELVGFSCAGMGLGYLAWTRAGFPGWSVAVGALAGLTIAMIRIKKMADLLGKKDDDTPQ